MSFRSFVLILIFGILSSCSGDKNNSVSSSQSLDNINIRLYKDPQKVHPIFSPSAIGREVFQYIFVSLADFHPDNYELTPILITAIPEGYITKNGTEEWINYDIELKSDALWSDGVPVTNRDYAYTLKMINHPQSEASRWRPYFQALKAIKLDPENSKKLTVSFDSEFMLSLDVALTTNILPAHIYDKEGHISKLDLTMLMSKDYKEQDSLVINSLNPVHKSATQFTDVVQCGPYRLSSYAPDQYIILDKVKDYWGAAYPSNPYLNANPDKITFKIVPDEMTAVTMAKEGKIDLMTMSESGTFLDLKNDVNHNKNWSFHVPQLNRYYFVALNNKSKKLSDKRVRRAMAHLADVDDFIENIDGGLGTRTVGHFHPTKDNYNNRLQPIPFDVGKANALLDESGWKMGTDNIRTKAIDGKQEKLEFDIIGSGSKLSKLIGLLYQESAAKAGIKLNLVNKKSSLMRKENLPNYNYDMALLAASLELEIKK